MSFNISKPTLYTSILISSCPILISHGQARSGVDGFGDETRSLLGADILISVTDVLGEIILMYRCWLLYEKNYLVITIPCLATFGGLGNIFIDLHHLSANPTCTACISGVIHFEGSSNPPATALPDSIIPLLLAGYSLLLFANVLTTGLIIYRIWYTSSTLPNVHRIVTESASRRAIILIIESGTLYILAELFIVVVFALNSPVQAVAGVVAVQIYVRLFPLVLSLFIIIRFTQTGDRTEPHCRRHWTWHVFRTVLPYNRFYVGRPS